jgi:hypothetical protein
VRLVFRLENYRPNYFFAGHGPAQRTSGLWFQGRDAGSDAAGRMKVMVDMSSLGLAFQGDL